MALLRFGPRAINELARLPADGRNEQQPQRVANVCEVFDRNVIGVAAHQYAAGSKSQADAVSTLDTRRAGTPDSRGTRTG